jgi:hypothetical protein
MHGKACTEDRHRRCVVCRSRYESDHRTAATQKVCSAGCRVVWRRKQAQRRRALDVDGYQQAERVRQRSCRDRRRGSIRPPPTASRRVTEPPPARDLSRAGLVAQHPEVMDEILICWDKAARLSRAELEHDLARILGESSLLLGKAGP